MKLQFLCAGHREWLAESPGPAIDCWSNGLETGKILCEEYRWNEALPHVGCAYEVSEIILSMVYMDRHNAVRFFTSSVYLLAKVLMEMNCYEDASLVYRSASQRLKRELISDNNERTYITDQIMSFDNKSHDLLTQPRSSMPNPLSNSGRPDSGNLGSSQLGSSQLGLSQRCGVLH